MSAPEQDKDPQKPSEKTEKKADATPKPESAPAPVTDAAPSPPTEAEKPTMPKPAPAKPKQDAPKQTPEAKEKVATTEKAEKSDAEKADAKAAKKAIGAGKTVLLVEDTIELAEVLQATIERLGLTVHHESHASKGLERFKELKPDLVLLDIGLPDMSGWKLLDGIKEAKLDPRPRYVVITAYGDPANRLMGKLQDVDSYLIKPFSPDEVEQVVTKVLGLGE